MTISKTTILAEVNSRTSRAMTQVQLDAYLAPVMNDVSMSLAGLKTSTSIVFSVSDNVEDLPADYRSMISVDGLIEKSYENLDSFRTQFTTERTPEYWAILNKKLHIWPTPSAQATIVIRYVQIDDDVDTIPFKDEFQEALIEGCCYKTYEGLGDVQGGAEEFTVHKGLYDEQITKLQRIYG